MEIRKITGIVPADKRAVETAFGSIEPQPVACCNWPEQYPYAPEVSFRMFHTGAYLMLRFDVREQWTMARVTEDNGEVWTDSCVEFFIAPDDSGYYYNFECTCIGRLLVGFRREREHATHATPRVMESILAQPEPRVASLPRTRRRQPLVGGAGHPPQALFMPLADGLERTESEGEPLQMRGQTLAAPFPVMETDLGPLSPTSTCRNFRTN